MKGMIFAAGLGTRFKPWTDHHPKALAVVNGKTLLERNVAWLAAAGIRDLLVNVHHFAGQIRDTIQAARGWGSRIALSDETDEVLETGGGLLKAQPFFDDAPFAVVNADILTDLNLSAMIAFHITHRPLATLAVSARDSSREFLFDADGRLSGWRNRKTGEEKIPAPRGALAGRSFSGIHIIEPAIFPLITRRGKFSVVDVYLDLARDHRILAYEHTATLVDVGTTESLKKAEEFFR